MTITIDCGAAYKQDWTTHRSSSSCSRVAPKPFHTACVVEKEWARVVGDGVSVIGTSVPEALIALLGAPAQSRSWGRYQ